MLPGRYLISHRCRAAQPSAGTGREDGKYFVRLRAGEVAPEAKNLPTKGPEGVSCLCQEAQPHYSGDPSRGAQSIGSGFQDHGWGKIWDGEGI